MTACSLQRLLILRQPSMLIYFSLVANWRPALQVTRQRVFQAPKYIHSFYFHKPKNENKNTALEIALNTFCSTIGERHLRELFLSKFSFVCCVGLQQWHHLTTIQLRVGFVLLTFILKCSMPTFTFHFDIYFNPKIDFYLLYNCLSKLATHAV